MCIGAAASRLLVLEQYVALQLRFECWDLRGTLRFFKQTDGKVGSLARRGWALPHSLVWNPVRSVRALYLRCQELLTLCFCVLQLSRCKAASRFLAAMAARMILLSFADQGCDGDLAADVSPLWR